MDPQPVQVFPPSPSPRASSTHPLVASVDLVLDEVIDVVSGVSIAQAFNFLTEQLSAYQTRKTVPVALISHDTQALTSAEVFARMENYAETKVRSLHTKVGYLRDLHCSKKTEKVTEILATAFETASLLYLQDYETYFILLQNLEAWDKHVVSNLFASLHDLLQDSNIRVGVLVEIAGDVSVFRNSLDYNIVFSLDVHEITLKGFQAVKEMVFLMLMSTEGFPVLSSDLAREIFSAPSFSDMRKQLKFQVIRHFMSAGLLSNSRFNTMYERLRGLEDVRDYPAAVALKKTKQGWLQAIGKLNTLLLSQKVPTVTSLLEVYSHADYRDVLPIARLYGAFDGLQSAEQWEAALQVLEVTSGRVSERLTLLYAECQQRRVTITPQADVSRARDSLDLFLSNEEVMATALDSQEISAFHRAYFDFLEQNKGLSKVKQSRKDALLNKPLNEDAKFDAFKRTSLREIIRTLFEEPLLHPEQLLREKCPREHASLLLDRDKQATQTQLTCPYLHNSVDMVTDVTKHLFYPHVYMGIERLEKQLSPDMCLVFHLMSKRGKKVDLSDVFDEYSGVVGRSDLSMTQ